MKLPTRKECLKLLNEYKLLKNMQRHVLEVNKVANFLAKKLKEKRVDINLELVDRASLLHDLDKFHTLKNKRGHGFIAADILRKKGYKKLATIVNKHILSSILDKKTKLKIWEEKIVFYADKRVKGDRIVSLKTRFNDLKKRYGINKKVMDVIVKSEPLVIRLEKEIFNKIGIKPKEINRL